MWRVHTSCDRSIAVHTDAFVCMCLGTRCARLAFAVLREWLKQQRPFGSDPDLQEPTGSVCFVQEMELLLS